ncbi:oxidoreductase [Trichodelitschia bisporula]|uniref:Oxidoreductase n=1 Tax=Trichodelitschia bisporula TaxID=703511 RepID=A0A6G1HJB1_9PEZI|nr:oxidoreductase [Trichodelitschia bisporula]
MAPRLENKTAIITGGASGFGKATAIRFAEEGAAVLIGDLNADGATAVANSILSAGGKAVALRMDVTSAEDWEKAVGIVMERWGRLDVVVNNAGTTYRNKPTLDVTSEEFTRVFEVNVRSVYLSVRAAVPTMQKNGGGSIINVSSIGSVRPRPGLVWYNASKAAVTNATKGLAAEYGPQNIRINSLAPLLSGTGLFESFVGVPDTPENREKFIGNVPLGRLTDPNDVANTALFLASDEGKFITGVNLEIDGGRGV